MAVEDAGPSNEFHHIPAAKGKGTGFEESFIKSALTKWDVLRGSQLCKFRYTAGFHKMAPEQFLRDLFSSPEVGAVLERVDDKLSKQKLSGAVTDVEWEHVKASVTSMAFFDRLETCDPPLVRSGGRLAQCMEEVFDDITVSDELRKMLVTEESENAELFSAQEKSELLFRIFKCLAIGGPMSQYEDTLAPYTEAAKRVYKALVAVQKNPSTQNVEVTSSVYLVKGVTAQEGWTLFPSKRRADPRNFCYVCVDQARYTVTIWYHVAQPVW